MKMLIQINITLALTILCPDLFAQHLHLNVGAQSPTQGSPLFFQNGSSLATNSSFVVPLAESTNGAYAGYFSTESLTLTAIGTGFSDAPLPGTQVRLRFVSMSGPAQSSFGVWDVPGFNEEENSATALTFSVPAGTTNGAESILLSENNGEPGADPFGHIHGRAYSATEPGLYIVGVQTYDSSTNGETNGPIHSPSAILPIYFQAGVTISSITREETGITITFASRAGSSYYVQETATPENEASWQDIAGPFTGNLLQTTTDAPGDDEMRFYRLRVTTP